MNPDRFREIRQAYADVMPKLLAHGRIDPYFYPWEMTTIEGYAWEDIRGQGLPLYPQFPVLDYFIDFGDPRLKIGVELDGEAFHDRERDLNRDQRLWREGWRIFRIPGRETLPTPYDIRETILRAQELGALEEEIASLYHDWGDRWSEGFSWALSIFYYGKGGRFRFSKSVAADILGSHRLVKFCLDISDNRLEAEQ